MMEGSTDGLKRGLTTSTDSQYEMAEYEILWVNSYGLNYQLKWSDKKKNYLTYQTEYKISVTS